ncbi:Precorrin-3B methylase [Prochlorococcus marinus subsp. marinus str. CCMP1375]|uniref:Precorrin-3B methylase n=1 Tax=Prochlorococcus marinus (strain SARG / CCMP1375 / SS120) TaxID=167539 RepID=Q7V9Z8_PROMA|nr:Precorrin-3B methylase [Prochlorococcus marinus subsp. marinus str. CCMP1375]
MLRLKARGHVDSIALSPKAAAQVDLFGSKCLVHKPEDIFQRFWEPRAAFIVVGAIGAVVRMIAPLITDKESDPAVVVMDSRAQNIVSLLGGHQAGADELACQLAEDFGGHFVSTGFSRTEENIALDSFGDAWGWRRKGDISDWKNLMILIALKEPIKVEQTSGSLLWKTMEGAINTLEGSKNQKDIPKSHLMKISSQKSPQCCWHPATLWVGIGCERNTSYGLVTRALEAALEEACLAREAIAGLATIDIKYDEPAIKSLRSKYFFPLRLYSAQDLSQIDVPNPSRIVDSEVGTPSVAEAASILAAGERGILKFQKHIYTSNKSEKGSVTIAIAEAIEPFAPTRGELHLVGSGPGDPSFLTNDSRLALARSAVWIGYKPYLDLLEPIRKFDQARIDSFLTNERDRCEQALNLATQGIRVSLISSGDSGIYGMAGLALELWLERPKEDRPEFKVHPGISSIQLAAARIGAPLMHDFCAISLSDCLTPWEQIEERVRAASISDFVIAFYNPKSKSRNWQLQKAFEILLQNKPLHTPIAFARQLGRADETVEVHTIGSFPIDRVDMLTLLLVGNSKSFFKDGCLVTPRGY